jgi:hypothetical protein
MYTGPQNTELVKAVDLLRSIQSVEVHLIIISAGFGILQEQDLVPPYECSFTNMKMADVRKRSQALKLQSSFIQMTNKGFDLIYLALGKRYMTALGKGALSKLQIPTMMFHGSESEHLIRFPCSAKTVKAFSKRGHKIHGVVGFKGDLLRILARYTLEKPNPGCETKKWENLNHLKKLVHRLGGLVKAKG